MSEMKGNVTLVSQIQDKTTKLNITKFYLRLYSDCHIDNKSQKKHEITKWTMLHSSSS